MTTLVSGNGRFVRRSHAPIRLRPGDTMTWHAALTIRHVGENDLTVVGLDWRPVFGEPLSAADELALFTAAETVIA